MRSSAFSTFDRTDPRAAIDAFQRKLVTDRQRTVDLMREHVRTVSPALKTTYPALTRLSERDMVGGGRFAGTIASDVSAMGRRAVAAVASAGTLTGPLALNAVGEPWVTPKSVRSALADVGSGARYPAADHAFPRGLAHSAGHLDAKAHVTAARVAAGTGLLSGWGAEPYVTPRPALRAQRMVDRTLERQRAAASAMSLVGAGASVARFSGAQDALRSATGISGMEELARRAAGYSQRDLERIGGTGLLTRAGGRGAAFGGAGVEAYVKGLRVGLAGSATERIGERLRSPLVDVRPLQSSVPTVAGLAPLATAGFSAASATAFRHYTGVVDAALLDRHLRAGTTAGWPARSARVAAGAAALVAPPRGQAVPTVVERADQATVRSAVVVSATDVGAEATLAIADAVMAELIETSAAARVQFDAALTWGLDRRHGVVGQHTDWTVGVVVGIGALLLAAETGNPVAIGLAVANLIRAILALPSRDQ